MSMPLNKILTSLSLALILASCGPSSEKSQKTKGLELVNSELFSTRPVNVDTRVFLLRLQNPALIETATIKEGVVTLNEAMKEELLKEQDEVLKELKKISEDIEVVYSMKLTMNALTIAAPKDSLEAIQKLPQVSSAEAQPESFNAPPEVELKKAQERLKKVMKNLQEKNSVTFIGTDVARNEYDLRGQGLKVGVIDTGIDYTHAMFGGAGTVEAYEAIDPDTENESFPNKKVSGGIDLVGESYTPGALDKTGLIPRPDKNPIDKRGHGTHVAGTIAGLGDGVNSYDGVAPAAEVHAIKVFGAGGTSDSVVIAALEYSLDPNSDLDLSDRLDVVNLSLGGDYGKPSINYSEAVKNTMRAGVSVVASAGNSGAVPYIVGAPSTTAESLSVGAGVDDSDWNWRVNGLKVLFSEEEVITLAVEGAFTKKLADSGEIQESLVYLGTAVDDLSDEQKTALPGKIALIDRGVIGFVDKVKKAEAAGAVAVVMVNNAPGDPIVMGGEGESDIPAVMITQSAGDRIKKALKEYDLQVVLSEEFKVDQPEKIDTLAGFSSWGPRSEDGLIKPEIIAPGEQILSAAAGTGNEAVKQNGTSMSGPHMAGVMALMKQRYPELSTLEHKAIVMGTAKIIKDREGKRYPVAAQGAGRVDVARAVNAKVLSSEPALSLGMINIAGEKTILKRITLKNISDEMLHFTVNATTTEGLLLLGQDGRDFKIKAGESKVLNLRFKLTAPEQKRADLDGYVTIDDVHGENLYHMPVLAVVKKISKIEADNYEVMADGSTQAGALVSARLTNKGKNSGVVLPFNLLAKDQRKPHQGNLAPIRSNACDLESVGYRTITVETPTGDKEVLQVAAKVHEPLTNWQSCMISVLIDSDQDGKTDQELVGVTSAYLPGINQIVPEGLYSFLLDAKKAREIRSTFEQLMMSGFGAIFGMPENYASALQGIEEFMTYDLSTLSILQADVSALMRTKDGTLNVRVAAVYEDSYVEESDDYLASSDQWHTIQINKFDQGHSDLPQMIELSAGESTDLFATKGYGKEELILYMPFNEDKLRSRQSDDQSQVLK